MWNISKLVFTGGDWPVFFLAAIEKLPWLPQIWSSYNGNGFGQNVAFVLGYKTFFTLPVKFLSEVLHLPWNIVELVIFFIPFWIGAFYFSFLLSRYFISHKLFNVLSSVIFATNTYALMLVGGGQMGVAIAYAFSPLIILCALRLIDKPTIKYVFILGLLQGFLLCIDPRIGGVAIFISLIFLLFSLTLRRVQFFVASLILAGLLNAFWVIPFIFSGTGGLSEAYTGTDILYFLSFAKLENTIALLHPNWPENFFGKVGFMRAEFLIFPLIAFSAFLFKTDKKIKVLGLTALVGLFLAKGVNDPFGVVYYFLSSHVPAFTMFRDATKWYLMIIIAYSILIPYVLYRLSSSLQQTKKFTLFTKTFSNRVKNKKWVGIVIFAAFLLLWCGIIRQLFLGQLTGTFKNKPIPEEYLRLERLITKDDTFYRTLWVPQVSRFGYYSNMNPAVATYDLVQSHDITPTFSYLNKPATKEFIENSAIRYVVIPYDSLGEIFLTDRKYDRDQYKAFIKRMEQTPWLTKDSSFKNIGVFKVNDFKPHAYLLESGAGVSLQQVSLTRYRVQINNGNDQSRLVFSEQYDPHWVLRTDSSVIKSTPYKKQFNSFQLALKNGNGEYLLEYTTQKWVYVGIVVSGISLIGIASYLLIHRK